MVKFSPSGLTEVEYNVAALFYKVCMSVQELIVHLGQHFYQSCPLKLKRKSCTLIESPFKGLLAFKKNKNEHTVNINL